MYGKEEMQSMPETERKKLRQLEASSIACHSLHLVISTSNADEAKIRLSSRRIVVSLLVHQLLLQFLHEIFFGEDSQIPVGFSEGVFPSITSALKETIVVAIEFEARPGLRLLLQKTLGLKKKAFCRWEKKSQQPSGCTFILFSKSPLRRINFPNGFHSLWKNVVSLSFLISSVS